MTNKINVSVSDIEHIETPEVSVLFGTIHIGGKKHRKVIVKTSNKFKKSIKTKIMEYCKHRQK